MKKAAVVVLATIILVLANPVLAQDDKAEMLIKIRLFQHNDKFVKFSIQVQEDLSKLVEKFSIVIKDKQDKSAISDLQDTLEDVRPDIAKMRSQSLMFLLVKLDSPEYDQLLKENKELAIEIISTHLKVIAFLDKYLEKIGGVNRLELDRMIRQIRQKYQENYLNK